MGSSAQCVCVRRQRRDISLKPEQIRRDVDSTITRAVLATIRSLAFVMRLTRRVRRFL